MLRGLSVLDICALSLGVYLVKSYLTRRAHAGKPLPPGPKGAPLIGNVADMPTTKAWLTFSEWGRKFGGIMSVNLLGRPMIILNTIEALQEFDKKSAIYSERPRMEMGGELVGYSDTLVLLRYGPRFRHYRKGFARYIGNGAIQNHHPLLVDQTRTFLKHVLKNPDDLMSHLRKLTGGIILKIAYGYDVVWDGADPYIDLIEGANENFNKATAPGAFMVDLIPSLQNLPSWVPGTGFLELAKKWRKDTDDMVEVPFNFTKSQMASGTASESFVSTSIEEGELSQTEKDDIKYVAASLYGGGADTTVSAQYAFFLAMTLYPDVQKKIQAEIESVVGTDRLPNHDDRPNMPYTNAVISETLRWNSVAPSGVPHVAIEDGFVGGYFIPKDSMILANLWGILHDPTTYPDPMTFDPERFIPTPGKEPQLDPRGACFGFGRRICPGMFLAEASLFSTIALSMAVFDVTNAVDESGAPVVPVHENTDGTISYPKPYKCSIRPRSAKAASLIAEQV